MPIARPIGSGSAISPIQLAGTSDVPEHELRHLEQRQPDDRARPRAERGPPAADARHGIGRPEVRAGGEHEPDDEARDDDRELDAGPRPDPVEQSTGSRARVAAEGQRVRPERDGVRRRGSATGGVPTRAAAPGTRAPRWTAAGHMSMYRTPVRNAWNSERAAQDEVARRASRGTTARCCRPPRRPRSPARWPPARPVVARRPARRPRRWPPRTRSRSSPTPAVEPVAGAAQVTSIDASAPLRLDHVRDIVRRPGAPQTDRARGPPRPPSGGPRPPRPGRRLEVGLRRIDGRDQDAGRRPGVLVERDPPAVGRRREAQTHEQQRPGERRSQQQPRREPASPIACAHRLSAVPRAAPRAEPEGASLGVVATPGDRASWFRHAGASSTLRDS